MKGKLIAGMLLAIAALLFYQYGRGIWKPMVLKITGKQTVAEVVAKYSDSTFKELSPLFTQSGIDYPPKHLALIAFKDSCIDPVGCARIRS